MEIADEPIEAYLSRDGAAQLLAVLRPYYVDPRPLLSRELAHSTNIYTATDSAGRLQAYFIVGWKPLKVGGTTYAGVYLGLSANHTETRRTFRVQILYERFRAQAEDWERANNTRLVVWWTTASAPALAAGRALFAGTFPDDDGTIGPAALPFYRAVRALYGVGEPSPGDHLAVLRRVASDTQYSASENATLRSIKGRFGPSLLESLGVREGTGDRLLCIRPPLPELRL
jgi:hypothetical protein